MKKKLPYEGPLVEVVYLCVESGICYGSGEGYNTGEGGW